jgi:hypothetical protein
MITRTDTCMIMTVPLVLLTHPESSSTTHSKCQLQSTMLKRANSCFKRCPLWQMAKECDHECNISQLTQLHATSEHSNIGFQWTSCISLFEATSPPPTEFWDALSTRCPLRDTKTSMMGFLHANHLQCVGKISRALELWAGVCSRFQDCLAAHACLTCGRRTLGEVVSQKLTFSGSDARRSLAPLYVHLSPWVLPASCQANVTGCCTCPCIVLRCA